MRHELSATTWRPMRSARPISESVPWRPPMATTASAAVTTTKLRTTPRPVAIGVLTNSLASDGSVPGRMPIVSPPAPRGPSRGRPHHPAQPAGQDDRAPPRASMLPDLLGHLEEPMGVGPTRIAVADHGDETRPLHGGSIGHARMPSEGKRCQRLISGRSPAEVAALEVQIADCQGAARRRGRRRLDPAAEVDRPSAGACERDVGTIWLGLGKLKGVVEVGRDGRERPVGIVHRVPHHPSAPRPREGAEPAGRAGHLRMPRGHPLDLAPRSRPRASGSTEPRKASVRWRASGATQRNPSVSGSCRHSAIAAPRDRRRSSPRGTATKHRHGSLVRHRLSSRASTIGRSSSRTVMTGTSSGTSAESWRPDRSISTPSIPTPRAPSMSATR